MNAVCGGDTCVSGRGGPADAPGRRMLPRLVLHALVLGSLLLSGAFVRLHNLSAESVWYDEYNSVRYLGAPALGAFLEEQQEYNDEMVPLYFVLQYYWAHGVGDSAWTLRLLSVLLGLSAIVLVYACGTRLFGVWGGAVAALCMALSPFMIHHSQGLRPYALLLVLGLISGMSFLVLLRGAANSTWAWWMNALANVALVWTHLFGCWLVAAQAGFLVLFCWPRRRWWWLGWAGIQAVGILPLALWVFSWQVDPPAGMLETPIAILDYAFARDTSTLAHHTSGVAQAGLPPLSAWLLAHCTRFEQATVPLFMGLALFFCGGVLWRFWRGPESSETRRGRLLRAGWLVCWLFLPIGLLYGFAAVWSAEANAPRYTIYGAPALYLLLGGGVAALPWRVLRIAVTGGLGVLLAVQAHLGMLLPTRPDFVGAVRYVERNAGIQDGVVYYPEFTLPTFAYNLANPARKLVAARDLLDVLDQIHRFQKAGRGVWVVAAESDAPLLLAPLRWYAGASDLVSEVRVFPGTNALYAQHYPAEAVADTRFPIEEGCPAAERFLLLVARGVELDWQRASDRAIASFREALAQIPAAEQSRGAFARSLGATGWHGGLPAHQALGHYAARIVERIYTLLEAQGRGAEALPDYERLVSIAPERLSSRFALTGLLWEMKRYEALVVEFREVLDRWPEQPSALEGLGSALLALKAPEKAVPPLEQAVSLRPQDSYAREQLARAYHAVGNLPAAVAAARALLDADPSYRPIYTKLDKWLREENTGPRRVVLWREVAQAHPDALPPWLFLGKALLDAGQSAAAVDALATALELEPGDREARRLRDEALLAAGRVDEITVPESAKTMPDKPEHLCTLAGELRKAGRRDAAKKAYLRAIDAWPEHYLAYDGLAALYAGKPEKYLKVLRGVAAAHPEASRPHFTLGKALAEQGRLAAASKALQQAAAANPLDAAVHALLARTLFEMQEYAAAAAACDAALEANPEIAGLEELRERAQAAAAAANAPQGGRGAAPQR